MSDISESLMQLMIDLRTQARQEKNWELSDRIRDRLQQIGITLQDKPGGVTEWSIDR